MPYYIIENNSRLIRKGNFSSGRPILSLIYKAIGKSQVARYFRMNLPPRINDDHIKLTSKIIEESRNIFREKFNSRDFYVLFYPGSNYAKKLVHYLKDAGTDIRQLIIIKDFWEYTDYLSLRVFFRLFYL